MTTSAAMQKRPVRTFLPASAPAGGSAIPGQPPGDAKAADPHYAEVGPLLAQLTASAPGPARDQLRERVITICLPLATNISKRYYGRGESADDLYQSACLGLVKAVDRFEVSQNNNFLSFAVPTILGEVRRHFRDNSWGIHVPRPVKEDFLRLRAAINELSVRLGRTPDTAEIAAELGWKPERVSAAAQVANAFRPDQLQLASSPDEDTKSFASTHGAIDPAYALVDDQLTAWPLVAALPSRERAILTMRFFRDMSQSQIADCLGISQMHVSRILAATLRQLREEAA